jgi:hypothetical protein
MSTKTYRGSCHCGQAKFEADVDLSQGTTKCNCTSCWKRRWWSASVKPAAFRSLAGASELTTPGAPERVGRGGFCKRCGVTPYAWVDAADWNDGESVSINVACLDDLDPAELLAAPVRYCDGRADNWWVPPAETRHL